MDHLAYVNICATGPNSSGKCHCSGVGCCGRRSGPNGLSIQNNQDEQQLDLAITYNEMGDFKNAKTILENLIKSTDSDALKNTAQSLLDKISEQ